METTQHIPADVRGRIIRASILPIEDEETMIARLRAGAEAVERGELDAEDFAGIWSQHLRELFRRASSVPAPADVRERVAKEVYLWEATRVGADESWALWLWREESNTRRRQYFNVADRILALLRTPRGDGEDCRLAPIVRAILERIDRYQGFHDRVGPADLTLPPVARTITEEEILALRAALRSDAQGEEDALGMLQASVDEYLWEAQNNPQFDAEAAFAALSREIRAALRSEAQGELVKEAVALIDEAVSEIAG